MRIQKKIVAAANGVVLATAMTAVTATNALAAELQGTGEGQLEKKLTVQALTTQAAPQTADEAKENLEQKQQEADKAQKSYDEAQTAATTAQKEADKAASAEKMAKSELDKKWQEAAAAFDSVKSDAAAAVLEAEKDKNDATTAKETAEKNVAESQSRQSQAETDEAAAKQSLERVIESSDYTSDDVAAARANASAAETDKNAKESAFRGAEATEAQSVTNYENATSAVSDQHRKISAAESAVATAQQKLDAAQKELSSAQKAFDSSIDGSNVEAIEQAQQAVAQARQAYDEANAALETAREELAVARTELTSAQANLTQAQSALASAQEGRTQALLVLEKRQADYEEAQATFDSASAMLDTINQELDRLSEEIVEKQNEKATAQRKVDDLNAKLPALETAKQEAQTQLDAVNTTGQGITSAREFYEWLGDTAQATRFDWDTKYVPGGGAFVKDYTNQGVKGDATSVDNIKKVFDYIRKCNELRRNAGLSELLITNSLMYEAQVGVNWSDENFAHNNTYNSSENLAWTKGDPFVQWYDKEYAKYQAAVAEHPDIKNMSSFEILKNYPSLWSSIGHYLNIVNPDYKYTGFAYTNQYANLITYCQTFYKTNYGDTSPIKSSPQTAYTVDEYEALFLEALAGPRQTDEQRAIITSKRAALESAEKALADAIASRDQATAQVAAATAEISQLQQSYDAKLAERVNAQEAKQAAEANRDQKSEERNHAYIAANSGLYSNTYINQLQQTVDSYAILVSVGENNLARCERAANARASDVGSANETLKRAESNLAALTASSEELLAQIETKRSACEQAAAELAVAQEELSNARAELSRLEENAVAALDAYEKAQQEVAAAKQAFDTSSSALQSANNRLSSILASYAVVEEKERAYAEAHESHMTAVENLEKAQTRLSDAKTALVDATLKLSEAQAYNAAAQKLSYEGADTPLISDERFAWLNDKVSAVKQAKDVYEARVTEREVASQVLADKKAELAEAQEVYAVTLADLAIAQDDYNALTTVSLAKATVSGVKTKTYNGKVQEQSIVVKVGNKTLTLNKDYKVSYKNNKSAGKATMIVTGIGKYSGVLQKNFTIKKAANTMALKAKATKSIRTTSVKKKKVIVKSLVSVKKNQGKVSYSNASKTKALKKFKVNAKNGTITVAKGTKKGLYKVRIKVVAKGNANYAAKTKYVTVRIRVK